MKAGDLVWIGCDDRTVEGWIMLASDNEQSLMLGFEAILDGHVGMMPVSLEAGVYRSIITGQAVAVVPRGTPGDDLRCSECGGSLRVVDAETLTRECVRCGVKVTGRQ